MLIGKNINNTVMALLVGVGLWLPRPVGVVAAQFSDPAGDTSHPNYDLTRLEWEAGTAQVMLRLTFAEDLLQEGWLADVEVSLALDTDRELRTGFKNASGLHSRGGADYSIDLSMAYGWNVAQLVYYRHKYEPPFYSVEKVQVSLGDTLEPNGSVLVVGASSTYGTDNHQVVLVVPISFFTNAAFPLRGQGSAACLTELFPCPLAVTNDVRHPLLKAVVSSFQGGAPDLLPDQGLADTANGAVVPDYPTDGTDLVAAISDPAGDCFSGACVNGEDWIGLKVYQHAGGVLSFEGTLSSYWFDDTALYALLLDLDDNPDTGERLENGSVALGVDLVAEFSNFDNPIGFPSILEGRMLFRQGDTYCPLPHLWQLGNGVYGAPGHIYLTLPAAFTAPGLAANRSGKIKLVAGALSPDVINFSWEDLVPDTGVLEIPLRCIQMEKIAKAAGGQWAVTFSTTASAALNFRVERAETPVGPWQPQTAELRSLGARRWEALVAVPPTATSGFYRVRASAQLPGG